MTFEAEFSAERTRLAPLFAAAVEADLAVHKARDEGVPQLDVAGYKKTECYEKTLHSWHAATRAIDHVVQVAIEDAKAGAHGCLPTLVAYLDLPGRYFRSGYTRGRIWHLLKQMPLDEAQQTLIRQVMLNQIETAGPEFQAAVKLAPRVWSAEFARDVSRLRHSDFEHVVRRAERLLAVVDHR